jgi:hypothetical protein
MFVARELKASLRTRSVGVTPRRSATASKLTTEWQHVNVSAWRAAMATAPCQPALRNVHGAGSIRWRTRRMGAARHDQTDARSRRVFNPFTNRPTRTQSQVQPSHMTLVSRRHCHRASQGRRRRPAGRREITFLHARGPGAAVFLLDRRPPEWRGGGSSSAGGARQATLLQRPAPSGVTPHRGRKPELMAGHSFRSGAGSRSWALAVATSAAAITAPGGQPSAQFNAWPPPCLAAVSR